MNAPRDAHGTTPFVVLTPYLIPDALRGKKVVNVGDGFILRAIERLTGRFAPERTFSPRITLTTDQVATVAASKATILAGANQLSDRWTVWPGLDAATLRARALTLVPFGIGLHGDEGHFGAMSEATKSLLLAMHERIRFSSWRCPHTVAWLARELPSLAPQLLMTSCPVVHGEPLLGGTPFSTRTDSIAVTVTERGDFWQRETSLLDTVARLFPRARRHLVLHQNWSPPGRFESLRHRWFPAASERLDPWQRLRQFAVQKGYRVVVPADADAAIGFYADIDLHVGSRLHAHLLCLSRSKRSWLVPVDARSAGIAESLDFPLCQPTAIGQHLDFDFERVRVRAREHFQVMQRFVASLPK